MGEKSHLFCDIYIKIKREIQEKHTIYYSLCKKKTVYAKICTEC